MYPSYNIDNELKIRKIIESHTGYLIETGKGDKYGYDIKVYRYISDIDDFQKEIVGYIEVEVGEIPWSTNYLKWYSFLARKVFVFNYKVNEFTDRLKNDADITIYLKFNPDLSDCFACDILTISKFEKFYDEIWGRKRNDFYLRAPLSDKRVFRGLDNCMYFIKEYFEQKDKDRSFTPFIPRDIRNSS